MSSLYDKYYSKINKDYIYNLSCKIIKDEFNIDVLNDKYFRDIYEKNINDAFNEIDTDDIVELNRKLLSLQINSYKSYSSNSSKSSNRSDKETSMILNASERIIDDSDSIYNFKIITQGGDYILEYLLLSKEENILFGNPLIIITINDSDIFLKLSSSYNLNNRTFLEYIPIDKQKLRLKNITEITIKNSLNTSVEKNGCMSISKINEDYIEVPENSYKIGDSIKINNQLSIIKNIRNNKEIFLDNIKDCEIKIDEKILNISESPLLIFKRY